ncbi:MAG: transaldolase [Sulfurimonas sp. RIFOXYD12_FULL_33_39]|uniref:transaldolase n=1 Tax=unclassified Sulfurimonas TaxID=2623549 RepID=UPI0008BDD2CB|nr:MULTISPECIES: transaldolase [unclassified Sulfurimonas]OHE04981.1 MAG: transaldolase [Sulfurimonas sp. RIFCSPLOWO2_12_FULL_34_6]OHE08799.1 MAG: transaldolase [Sulfurimonas sp. RIFOXYD12_FULL_33_39]OHE14084.1 MAG: transaldolase [Sulfurimonas sp. RIFOXYD2_FULL_34_21]DAB27261.1 MAG TPA: transaldolase [Sulfurimonas sp. UBA10385]
MYLKDLKFSLWADFIERDYLDKEFKELIDSKIVNGATSNPAIFKNAILNSSAYKEQLSTLASLAPKEKYEAVAIYDIQKAADILKPLYDVNDDGYVSIEVDPFLCDDAEATIAEGERLFGQINRKNVMIKVPATDAGYIAMAELTSKGIPVNATLIFKKEQALSCAKAFKEGVAKHGSKVDTVISVFVSRVDRALDEELSKGGVETALSGIYNSADIYAKIQEMNVEGCRTLFASTGVKDDSLSPHYYIEKLLAYNSVNTAPVDTIKAFDANGEKVSALPISNEIIEEHFKKIEGLGIDFDAVLDKQISDGLKSFKDAFRDILESL